MGKLNVMIGLALSGATESWRVSYAVDIFLLPVVFIVQQICLARRNGWKEENKELAVAPFMQMNVLHKP